MVDNLIHEPVLVQEVLEYLSVQSGRSYIDGTSGTGGHTLEIARLAAPDGFVLGCDLDSQAIEIALRRMTEFSKVESLARFSFEHESYLSIRDIAKKLPEAPSGILFDFGCSSIQLDDPSRGFSLRADGPLDMRFDNKFGKISAADVIADFTAEELADIFYFFGEERRSRPIAKRIVAERSREPIKTTRKLKEVVESVTGKRAGKISGATRVFQALRIYVNSELQNIERVLPEALEVLQEGGNLVAITFHSLEDRIVKQSFKKFAEQGVAKILTKKPICPLELELRRNPRARSSKLRAIKKVSE